MNRRSIVALVLGVLVLCGCTPDRKAEFVTAPEMDIEPDVCKRNVRLHQNLNFGFYCVDGFKFYAAREDVPLTRALDKDGKQVPCKCRYKEKERE